MGHEPFPRIKPDLQSDALATAGYSTGTLNDRWRAFFQDLSTLSNGTLFDHMDNYFSQQGYTGTTFIDKFKAWCEDGTGASGTITDVFIAKLEGGLAVGAQFVDGSAWQFVDGSTFNFVN